MKNYIEVLVIWGNQDPKDFISAMKEFETHMNSWEFLEEKSEEYSLSIGNPSCILLKTDNKVKPAVAITIKKNNTFFIANIVPKEISNLSVTEYNKIALQFVKDIKKYAKNYKLPIKVKTTNENIELADIISGTKTRAFFEKYLNLHPLSYHPLSYHPLDIKRLDVFICAVFRYSRGKIDTDLLKGWLVSKKKWSEKDATWCIERIKTGLSVLKVNKDY